MLAEEKSVEGLLDCLRRQTWRDVSVYVCVNQPEEWREDGDEWQRGAVEDNRLTLERLAKVNDLEMIVLDRSSKGRGWTGKRKGVGWARKVMMDRIVKERDEKEIVVSLDADTRIEDEYLEGVVETLEEKQECGAIAAPYYHPTTGEEGTDRRLLRYECYMRHYMINMLEAGNPYAFTALGSAMAFWLGAYRKVGGITPLQGGEDFYLMQKFAKTGKVAVGAEKMKRLTVRPQGRKSRRVPFGTGPAVAMTLEEQEMKYPFYAREGFEKVRETFELFPALYDNDIETPMSEFLRRQLGTDELWQPLRKNYKDREHFVRACKEKTDGLRILQYLRTFTSLETAPVDFAKDKIEVIDAYRYKLFAKEMELRAAHPTVGLAQ